MKFYKFTSVTLPSQMAQSMAASGSWGLPAEEHAPLEIDFYHRTH